jgi:uncharacterized protein (DUF927 family)
MDTEDELVDAIEQGSITNALANSPDYMTFPPFAMTDEGLTMTVSERGLSTTVVISSPFEVIGLSRDAHGVGWGKTIRFCDADGRVHVHHVAAATLHGDAATLAGELEAIGLHINRKSQRAFAEYLNGVQPPGRVTLVNRTGWHDIGGEPVFVLPEETIGGKSLGETILLDGGGSRAYAASGDLEAWQAGVGALTIRQPWAILAVSTALSGSLAYLVGAEGGGVHFFGPSSIGKSTLLAAAASVWGRGGTPGYITTWRATANGLEGAAARTTDTGLVLDELSVGDAREVGAGIYALANGTGKQRARRDGSAAEPRSWRATLISSGELPIEAKIAEEYSRKAQAGQTVRLLDIPADRDRQYGVFDTDGGLGDAGKLADAIKRKATSAYGTAGPALVRTLVAAGLDMVARVARTKIEKFVQERTPKQASEQVGRVARKFALIAVAGELAILTKIAPWAEGEAWDAAAQAFERWTDVRGGTGSHEDRQAVAQVRLCIEQHGDARFDPLPRGVQGMSNITDRPVHNRLGWRKGEGKLRLWFVTPECWKNDVCKGLDPVAVARTLARRGMLRRPKVGKDLTRHIRINGQPTRVYVITAAILA